MPYIGTSPSQGVRRVHTYTATANQTSFSGAGAEGATLSYKDSNFVDVYQNGVKLGDADYTATSGTAIVLGTGATVSDLVVVVAYDVFSVADTVSKADGGTFDDNITMAGTLAVTGETTLATHLNLGDNDKIKLGASADLEIFHDGSNSKIVDGGTGNLNIQADDFNILNAAGDESKITASSNGAVQLLNDNSVKLATTSTGVTVTGGSSTDLIIDAATDNATLTLKAGSSDSGAEGAFAVFIQNTTNKWQMGMNTDNSFRLYSYSASAEVLNMDSTGAMTKPLQPRFSASGSAVTASGNVLKYLQVAFDVGSNYSTSTGRFTAPVAGTYIFYCTAIGASTNDVYRYYTRKNGTTYPDGETQIRLDTGASGSEYGYGTSAIIMEMSASDYAEIYFAADGGNATHGNSTSGHEMFSGYLLF